MKIFKALLVILALVTVVATLVGCSSKSTGTAKEQVATVKRGNLTLDITAAGNLALSRTEDLAIDLFYPTGTKGTIGSVLVEAGDSVKEGQLLVTLDTDEWSNQLTTLANQVTTQERNLLQAQINIKTGEQNLKNAKDAVTTRETSILSAEISLQQAQTSLDSSISSIDYNTVTANLNKAKSWYYYVSNTLKQDATVNQEDWTLALEQAQQRLDIAQANYDNTLSGFDTREVDLKKKQVQVAQRALAAAQEDLKDTKDDVPVKETSLTLVQGKLQDAQQALVDAKQKLTEARGKSPEIKAPFDGFVTQVNVAGGDEVLNGTIAVTVADPNKFEAAILVSEMDIMKVKLGGAATVQATALSGVTFTANVTQISPTATIASGVVNYSVKVELQTENNTAQMPTGTAPAATGNTTGQLSTALQRAVESGRITQAQADQMLKSGTPPAGFTPPAGTGFSAAAGSQAQGQLPSTVPQSYQLRQGLTVTVNIIVTQRNNVLLVPNGAVTKEGNQSYVQVVSATGTKEKRAVKTGISDWQNTEITDGLTEGEQVSVPKGTVTTTTSSSQNRGPGIPFLGPGGR